MVIGSGPIIIGHRPLSLNSRVTQARLSLKEEG